jgi:hypothetical protein
MSAQGTWSLHQPTAASDWPGGDLMPDKVLYYYDEPLIFTVKMGLFELLVQKIDDLPTSGLYLASHVKPEIISSLKGGALSIYGALMSERRHWILELSPSRKVRRYWEIAQEQIPQDYLPTKGRGLAASLSTVADSIEQASAFFALRFSGGTLTPGIIHLSSFKAMVDDAYDALRKILFSSILRNPSSRILDLEIYQPRLSSLIIAVERPIVNEERLREKHIDIGSAKAFDLIIRNGNEFIEIMKTVVREAERGEIKQSTAQQFFPTLDQVADLIPSQRSSFEAVEFNSNASATPRSVTISGKVSERIRRAYQSVDSSIRTLTGGVIEINAERSTFVIKDYAQRQTTCVADWDNFEDAELRIGQIVRVKGDFTERSRRDLIVLQSPILHVK